MKTKYYCKMFSALRSRVIRIIFYSVPCYCSVP
ncbi:hypothetical protein T01_6832 [Trichinella spiralis]|uniref:Uncharacterized protein n=1 Tax=Trichinella spiralis TaxID=6334 RepID=A0A0V0YR10_TRISP|nr:hypothetical protein T01_6832 [Trichinella spiralis]